MLSRDQRTRAPAKLQAHAPAPVDEVRLREAEEIAVAIVREAAATAKPVASVLCDLSESYYQYLLRRRRRSPKRAS
jgi:hypothetical protein